MEKLVRVLYEGFGTFYLPIFFVLMIILVIISINSTTKSIDKYYQFTDKIRHSLKSYFKESDIDISSLQIVKIEVNKVKKKGLEVTIYSELLLNKDNLQKSIISPEEYLGKIYNEVFSVKVRQTNIWGEI